MNVTYYPYAPIHVGVGEVVVLDVAAPKVYTDLVEGFRRETDVVRLSTDELESLVIARWSEWYGDPVLELDLDHQFQRVVLKRFAKLMSEAQQTALMDQARQLTSAVLETSFLLDLPLDVTPTTSLGSIVKFSGLHFSQSAWEDTYATLETLIKTIIELDDQQLTVLTNVSHYLNVSQIRDLVGLVKSTAIPVLIIEFSSGDRREFWVDCDYIRIDADFSDSRELRG